MAADDRDDTGNRLSGERGDFPDLIGSSQGLRSPGCRSGYSIPYESFLSLENTTPAEDNAAGSELSFCIHSSVTSKKSPSRPNCCWWQFFTVGVV